VSLNLEKCFLSITSWCNYSAITVPVYTWDVLCSVTIPAIGQATPATSQLSVETGGQAYSSHCNTFCTVLLKEYVTEPVRGYT
jgi:hypothetical protein